MIIDTRRSEMTEALMQLRELFPSCDNAPEPLEVLVSDRKHVHQIRAFASMSGFKTVLCREDGHYRVSITGSSCGCFR